MPDVLNGGLVQNVTIVDDGGVQPALLSFADNVNTPTVQSGTTALAANPLRKAWSIQNCGVNPIYVRLGVNAGPSAYHLVLKAGSSNDDGNGGFFSDQFYQGLVTVTGSSMRYVVTELT